MSHGENRGKKLKILQFELNLACTQEKVRLILPHIRRTLLHPSRLPGPCVKISLSFFFLWTSFYGWNGIRIQELCTFSILVLLQLTCDKTHTAPLGAAICQWCLANPLTIVQRLLIATANINLVNYYIVYGCSVHARP